MLERFQARDFITVTAAMQSAFARDGFLVLDNLIPDRDCLALIEAMADILDDADPSIPGTVFSSRDGGHARERYFLDSGRDIRLFYEDEADKNSARAEAPLSHVLNKVGHALHDRDPRFERFSRRPRFRRIVADLGISNPLLLQSMYIFKPPLIGGEVVWHQDATFLWTEPQSCLGLWVALEDADIDNGCLWGLPGHHREAAPRCRFRRRADGRTADSEILDPRSWPDGGAVAIEAPRGTVVVLDSQFPHRSGTNRSAKSRSAYTLHVIDAEARYAADNWLQWPADDPPAGFDR